MPDANILEWIEPLDKLISDTAEYSNTSAATAEGFGMIAAVIIIFAVIFGAIVYFIRKVSSK